MRYMLFELKISRLGGLTDDKLALTSDVWNIFIRNCLTYYKSGENIILDEPLFSSMTRCRLQNMHNKPDKFYIKF